MGDEETAEILAELRKISNRSAQSRFDSVDENPPDRDVGVVVGPPSSPVAQPSNRGREIMGTESEAPPDQDVVPLSPWAKFLKTVPSGGSASSTSLGGREAADEEDGGAAVTRDGSVLVAPPPAPPELPQLPQLDVPTLLADSNAPSKMGCAPSSSLISNELDAKPKATSPSAKPLEEAIKPWKRGPRKPQASTADNGHGSEGVDGVVIVAGSRGNARHGPEPTLGGDRGGASEGAGLPELPPEDSAKSASACRSLQDEDVDSDREGAAAAADAESRVEPPAPPMLGTPSPGGDKTQAPFPITPDSLPLGTQPRNPATAKKVPEVDVMVVDEGEKETTMETQPPVPGPITASFKSDNPGGFPGERGGDARDDELLAMLRAVSATSSSNSRFNDGGGDDDNHIHATLDPPAAPTLSATDAKVPGKPTSAASKEKPLPPWKQKRGPSVKKQQPPEVEVLVVLGGNVAPRGTTGDNQGTSSTAGPTEPGGEAQDRERSAGVRDVGAAAAGDVTADTASVGSNDPPVYGVKPDIPSTFQGDRGGAAEDAELLALLRGVSEEASSSRFDEAPSNDGSSADPADVFKPKGRANSAGDRVGFKSNLPQTFSGDRGGAAEDAELLALLKGVSSTSSDRFADSNDAPRKKQNQQLTSDPQAVMQAPQPVLRQEESTAIAVSQPSDVDELGIIEISRESLPTSLKDKNWKVRVAAIEFLTKELLALVSGQARAWDVDSNRLLPGLDDLIPTLLEDSNATVLDKALDFTLLYAEHCQSAGTAEQASRIVSSLVQKNGFSSRPSTVKSAFNVALKLMEVGTEGTSSIHAITNVLLNEGLVSKKPKVVQASVSLIQDAIAEFGASCLPLASLIAAAPKLLSHSNQSLRKSALEILAEICRSLGSKSHVQDVLDKMKKAQVSELDALLSEKPVSTSAKRELRMKPSMQEGAKDIAAQRFAGRPAINLMQSLGSTDFHTLVAQSKWSEKVKALNIVLECAGEKPYKLVAQSSSSNYAPLISELKKLLGHTHFAVCTKSMDVLTALAEGVGETLSPHLRPLLTTLLRLAKDKKLTSSVNSCLDSFFGRILGFDHLLDKDDSMTQVLDESKEKNTLARATAMDFLVRCVIRNESSGPRGALSKKAVSGLTAIFVEKLDDSSSVVRKASLDGLKALRDVDSSDASGIIVDVIESLKEKNPRAYKALAGDSSKEEGQSVRKTSSIALARPPGGIRTEPIQPAASLGSQRLQVSLTVKPQVIPDSIRCTSDSQTISLDRALTCASSYLIPLWDAPEDDSGILSGLRSSKWILRQDAIKSITAFIESGMLNSSEGLDVTTSSLLTIVGEYTRGFKETNVNIMKAIIRLFVSVCETHEALETPVTEWIAARGIDIAVGKLTDKKLSDGCKQLLSCLCAVYRPLFVLLKGFEILNSNKSPLAHEEFLRWTSAFGLQFGCASLGAGVNDVLPFLIEECESTNVKVKREALLIVGTFYTQLGPSFKAIAMNRAKSALREELEKCFGSRVFDATLQAYDWPKRSILDPRKGAGPGVVLEVPTSDIMTSLGDDCIQRLMSKEGKTAWKVRKEALEEVEAALKRTTGILNVSGPNLKNVMELTRAVRDRLTDTQINLKPVAARVISVLLSVVDKATQAKLGRIVFAPLINAAMNDIKKPMRDAALDAIRSGTIASELVGGGINDEALEPLIAALVSEVTEASARAGGLPEVLQFILGMAEFFPNLEENSATRGQSLADKFAGLIVECMTSSKTETRTLALALLDTSIERSILSVSSVQRVAERLKPAKHRTVGPVIAKYASRRTSAPVQGGKENAIPATSLSDPSDLIPRREALERNGDRQNPSGPSFRAVQIHETLKNPLFLRGGTQAKPPVSWLEYPEEPTGAAQYGGLRQSWSGMLPPATAAALFPSTGIKKQDDAQPGCDLLVRAVEIDAASGTFTMEAHTEFIVRWLVVVLCVKEATVGLQTILSTAKIVFTYLMERQRPMTEAETFAIVPFIIDRAGTSKGRFQEMFIELVSLFEDESLLPIRSLGSMCVMVVERSNHAKGRVFACRLCAKHVERSGTVFVGKRGVLTMAKALSEESISENKVAVLDVMEAILLRMNGDLKKLVHLCEQNLSEKARSLIEERWLKLHQTSDTNGHEVGQATAAEPAQIHHSYIDASVLQRDLPPQSASQAFARQANLIGNNPEANDGSSAGTAAALRARLLRAREMSKPVEVRAAPLEKSDLTGIELYNAATESFNVLTSTRFPIDDNHPALLASIDSLKEFHAAVSKQPPSGTDLSEAQLEELREQLTRHIHEVINRITSLVRLSFQCGPRSVNAGVSVSLVSVCIATFMAMLRDVELAVLFSHDDLSLLIREVCTDLLDPRLAGETETIGRAMNKLAVLAATEAPRTAAFQSLMHLQDQVLREAHAETSDEGALRMSRLSKVISKLFGRVVKSEEAKPEPYSIESVDLESLVCSIEDILLAHASDDAATDMARVLTESIVSTYGASALLSMLQEMGMGLDRSQFSELVSKCVDPGEDNAMLVPSPSHTSNQSDPSTPPGDAMQAMTTHGTARDVASLVSTLGSAPQGPIRDEALHSLREYTAVNGEAELNEHLQHVSSPFRAFIEQQLQGSVPRPSSRRAEVQDRAIATGTMSARLKSLRSRLAATELAVQTAVDAAPLPPTGTGRIEVPVDESYAEQQPSQYSPPRRASRLAQPTPSKLIKPSQSKLASSSPGAPPTAPLTLRERLAASQENRRQQSHQQVVDGSTQAGMTSSSSAAGTVPEATAGARSATLRARLEAAKQLKKYQLQQQHQQAEDSY